MNKQELQSLLYKLADEEEVELLNEAAPLHATNEITGAFIVSVPVTKMDAELKEHKTMQNKIVLTYKTGKEGRTV